MDFVADALFDGRRLHTLTVIDNFTRERMTDKRVTVTPFRRTP
ncbi:hypothetical protein PUP68_17655 [Pseudomonas chlororaphis]|nr:hypothetical protein [Pseudomonas chlororaphis]AZC31301.1 Mobile element protein [Pseudomonas chlororaphis subsp. piscium]WDG78072.1 hypothetical protein PUP77_27205 [Pseudomonas chlororaphis]WDG82691.1 hypothetical protein PUP68_17655 [Pseudomonas chlororaphis]WDG89095.1 hypothetical protein PUP49_17470 [Pseudomonas chlororaphis]